MLAENCYTSEINTAFLFPMQLFLIPGKKFDQGRFQSRARQPLLSRKRVSRNQQNNVINCNFRQASKLEPKTYLFFSKSLSFIGLCKILQLLGNSKRETRMALQKILRNCKVWRECGFFMRFGPFFDDEPKAGQDNMFILTFTYA